MENLHLIVGLGNPGSDYSGTRHNAGFLLVDLLASRWRAKWTMEKKFQSRVARAERDGRRVVLCQPQTYMNASGEAVGALVGFYRVAVGKLMVVVDDADLPLGEVRLRARGSSGGHHGLESLEQQLATQDFARLRLGIGRAASDVRRITNHVLGSFSAAETKLLEKVLTRAGDQVECWLTAGIGNAMNQFNGVIRDSA